MGLLATGTSCLALVWVMGRRRVPAPPARISAFTAVGLALGRQRLRGLGGGRRAGRGGGGERARRSHARELGAGDEHEVPTEQRVVLAQLGALDEVGPQQPGLVLLTGP